MAALHLLQPGLWAAPAVLFSSGTGTTENLPSIIQYSALLHCKGSLQKIRVRIDDDLFESVLCRNVTIQTPFLFP